LVLQPSIVWHTAPVPKPVETLTLALVLGLWTAAPARGAEARALTLDEAVARAVEANEQAEVAAARVEAAEARLEKARALFWPDVNGTLGYTRSLIGGGGGGGGGFGQGQGGGGFKRDDDQFSAGLGLTWTLLDFRAFPLLSQAERARAVARLDASELRRAVGFEAARAWLACHGAEQVERSAERRLNLARRQRDDAQARAAARLVSGNDVTRAELEVANAESASAQATYAAQEARLALADLLALEGSVSTATLPPELAGPIEARSAESLVERGRAQREDLAARRVGLDAQAESIEAARRWWWPRLSLDADYAWSSQEGFSGTNDSASVGLRLTLPLFDGFEGNADAAERAAVLREQAAVARAQTRGVEQQVRRALAQQAAARATLEAAKRAEATAERNVTESETLYGQGLLSAYEVADAGVRRFEAEVARVRAELEGVAAALALKQALGQGPGGESP
jgi:outer membrane protein